MRSKCYAGFIKFYSAQINYIHITFCINKFVKSERHTYLFKLFFANLKSKLNNYFRFIGFEIDEIKLDLNLLSTKLEINSSGIELEKGDSNIKAPEKRTINLKFDVW